MNDAEKYLFDLNGYLVIEDVLTPDEIAFANEAIDHHSDQERIRPAIKHWTAVPLRSEVRKDAGRWAICSTGKNLGAIPFERC